MKIEFDVNFDIVVDENDGAWNCPSGTSPYNPDTKSIVIGNASISGYAKHRAELIEAIKKSDAAAFQYLEENASMKGRGKEQFMRAAYDY